MFSQIRAKRAVRARKRILAAFLSAALTLPAAGSLSRRARAGEPVQPAPEAEAPRARVLTQELVCDTVMLPCDHIVLEDDARWSDETELLSTGSDGMRRDLTLVTYENGREVSRTLVRQDILREPVDAVTLVGSKPGSRYDSQGAYLWPCEGVISSYFGPRSSTIGSKNHRGLDIANEKGTSVRAADSGDVIYADWATGYGNFIKIQHDNGDVTCYGHLSEIRVSVGDRVAQGDEIALMGSTGVSSGPHLHFEVRPAGQSAANPLDYLPDREA